MKRRSRQLGAITGRAVCSPTKNPAFRRWFGDSVVKDEAGCPVVTYHWTPSAFTKFKPGGPEKRMSGQAIWLSTDPSLMNAAHNLCFTRMKDGKPLPECREKLKVPGGVNVWEGVNAMPLFARIERPLEIVLGDRASEDARREAGLPTSPYYLTPDEVRRTKAEGYDGVIARNADGTVAEMVVLDAKQVKSATGNSGKFSRTNADVMRGLGRRRKR